MVHDILPLLRPEFFPEGAGDSHARWLECVAREADALVCVSQAVADETMAWLREHGHSRAGDLRVEVVHHGADLDASHPTTGMPPEALSS